MITSSIQLNKFIIIREVIRMNIAAYCRVSTNSEDQLHSLEAQQKFFEEYAQRVGHNLTEIYSDEGISGTKLKNRKALNRLVKDAKQGKFQILAVKDVSRLARNTLDFLSTVRELKAVGVRIIFVNYNMDTEEVSEFSLTILAAVAQEESANTSKRVKFGKERNAKQGKVPNSVYGYDKIKGDLFKLYINDKEASVVKRIYKLYTENGDGASRIAQILNSEGLRTKRNKEWSQNAIRRILTNRLYTGEIINGREYVEDFLTSRRATRKEDDWYVKQDKSIQIIDIDTFRKAQRLLAERQSTFNLTKERQSNRYAFSTLIKCKHCGYSFRRIERKYKNTYVKWTCSGRNANGKDSCPNRTLIDERELLSAIKIHFISLISNKEKFKHKVMKEFNKNYKSVEENNQIEQQLIEDIKRLKKAKEKELDLYRAELIKMEELKERVEPIELQIRRLEDKLRLVKANITVTDVLEDNIKKTYMSIESMLEQELFTNAQLKRLIECILVDKDGNVEVQLRLLSEVGLDENVPICYDHTQRCN